jgi:asparagine synthetase B (glutamine-hydrolysing)
VLWNARERRLFAFRDLTGARPFFYSFRSGSLLFSNTLQAFFVFRLFLVKWMKNFSVFLTRIAKLRSEPYVYREIAAFLQACSSAFRKRFFRSPYCANAVEES